jgi:hypothetical protein
VLPNVHESPTWRKSLPQKSIPPRRSREERLNIELSSMATGLAATKNGIAERRVRIWVNCMLMEGFECRWSVIDVVWTEYFDESIKNHRREKQGFL